MAKQSGIHQLRGKVGEHSYYRQTGVSSGLVRSINQGMSARVKTGEEYANTRLNNAEFGAAGSVASVLGQLVQPKFRPMILPFSQSRMAKEILRLARENDADWGQRVVQSTDTARICDILNAQSKNDPFNLLSTLSVIRDSATEGTAIASYSADQAALMQSLGISALTISCSVFGVGTGEWSAEGQMMTTSYAEQIGRINVFDETDTASAGYNNSESFDIDPWVPAPVHHGHQIVVFVVIPLRVINNKFHVLQEYCSFFSMPLPPVTQP